MNKIAAAIAALCFFGTASAAAQATYPTRAVKVLVGIPPGGAPDLAARIVADKLNERLKQPVLVESRPGSNGNIAADAIAKATPDGYTLLLGQAAR